MCLHVEYNMTVYRLYENIYNSVNLHLFDVKDDYNVMFCMMNM